ncbi:MAG TPA: hypothetical protein VHX40_01895, partial [Acidimicrobiales bacterium]|nr:hypothetical protein [Acidimicrobiales bacterium]
DIENVVAQATAFFGDEYAGWWIDRSGRQPILTIVVAGDRIEGAWEAFQGQLYPGVVATTKLMPGKYTLTELMRYKSILVNHVRDKFTAPGSVPSFPMVFGIDTASNAVSVALTRTDAGFLPALQVLLPVDALHVRWLSAPLRYSGTVTDPGG